ncbi:VWA domain-containing protein [Rhodococcoides kroppenstedtii]|uniref:VWA domain-containing protein n=1 Tax=Rhodococcoides kroppenstedtii TaxID=293050 RepID=UPI001BDE7FE8|nr:VWA domain-containing protein [Rhodococcus kroppenstedtii]MBT1192698.1 substrate-binding domain-containing protein [Rhodococcus kroppenstedtii]
MGNHRRGHADRRRRGVSRGVVATVVVLVLLAAAVVGWFAVRDRSAEEAQQAARACVEGEATLAVTADPDVADVLRTLGESWTAGGPVVRDHCITTEVTAAPTAVAAEALAAPMYDPSVAGPEPALWVPTDTASAAAAVATRGTDITPRSVVTSPVVLGAAPTVADRLSAAESRWTDLPALVTSADPVRLALPGGPTTAATVVAVATDPATETQPLTVDRATSPAAVSAVSRLALAAAEVPAEISDVDTALDAIVRAPDPAAAPLGAVPVTEQQLATRVREGQQLAAFRPSGPTPMADHPGLVLATADPTARAAAAEFLEYVRSTPGREAFLAAGFRVPGGSAGATDGSADTAPEPIAGLDFPAVDTVAPVPTPDARAAVLGTVAAPSQPASTTLLLDVSGSMESIDGGSTRLDNVRAALGQATGALSGDGRLGVWIYSRGLDGSRPYRVLAPLGPAAESARTGLDALASITPQTATSTYAAVLAAYRSAVENWTPDGPQSVLLVTDGPNDDTSISSSSFLQSLAGAVDPARPVRLDVVSLADNSDIDTLRSAAGQTGGDVIVTASSDPGLAGTLERLTSAR